VAFEHDSGDAALIERHFEGARGPTAQRDALQALQQVEPARAKAIIDEYLLGHTHVIDRADESESGREGGWTRCH
jgi:hypothetical protein